MSEEKNWADYDEAVYELYHLIEELASARRKAKEQGGVDNIQAYKPFKDLVVSKLKTAEELVDKIHAFDNIGSYACRLCLIVKRMKYCLKHGQEIRVGSIGSRTDYERKEAAQQAECENLEKQHRLSVLEKFRDGAHKGIGWNVKAMAFSDLHGRPMANLHPEKFDLVLIAGDICPRLNDDAAKQKTWVEDVFCKWCQSFPNTDFILIGGDCDRYLQSDPVSWPSNVHYIQDQRIEIKGVAVYGTPWVTHAPGRHSVVFEKGPCNIEDVWEKIPKRDCPIVMTHMPPRIEGSNIDWDAEREIHCGSESLAKTFSRVPYDRYNSLLICGHIHSGDQKIAKCGMVDVANVSLIDAHHHLSGGPLEFLVMPADKVIIKPNDFCGDIDDFARLNEPTVEFDDYFKDDGQHPRHKYRYRYFRGEEECPFKESPQDFFWHFERNLVACDGLAWVTRWLFDHTRPELWPDFIKNSTAPAIDRELLMGMWEVKNREERGVPATVRIRKDHFGVEYETDVDWKQYFGKDYLDLGKVSVRDRFRYYNGENQNPFEDTPYGLYWGLERNLSTFGQLDKTVLGAFGSTNPCNWPPFMDGVHAPYVDMALIYFIWLDFSVHVYGGDRGDAHWLRYFDYPVISGREAKDGTGKKVDFSACDDNGNVEYDWYV